MASAAESKVVSKPTTPGKVSAPGAGGKEDQSQEAAGGRHKGMPMEVQRVMIDYGLKDGRFPYDNVMVADRRYHLIYNTKPAREFYDFQPSLMQASGKVGLNHVHKVNVSDHSLIDATPDLIMRSQNVSSKTLRFACLEKSDMPF